MMHEYEPYEEEDRRQEAWDRLCECYPKCSCCHGSIYPGDIYLEYEDIVLCEDCLEAHTYDVADYEV